ncbi:NAD(P)/FAD-dependent oxidoreductase [Gordonia sp. NB41Y]|uniref:flavin-containing monooxygenase n=1 Tax=Gordonia sp. NB41Y TaxID=875808 RepID=UPI0002BD77CC|nr:NAD(P)/FAD-dependent oxidoreductase [Gordonia sp. NB41Y]EMP15282.1 FAD-containing monooxygenase EthA [Gordonia sp. NB41Y]WLP92848.1 NAD(P)/FAD-dependent oxidoreductase [Gordonia sp. NB41Y]
MTETATTVDALDVLIVGAGISGIGAAHYLTTQLPGTSFAILEGRDRMGGTWNLFKYPGIRSDSDLHTFGFAFKPWTDKQSIADASRILDYLQEAIDEDGIGDKIRYQHKVISANWSSAECRWTVDVERGDTGETTQIKARWLFSGAGYYNYDEGYTPEFEGRDRFTGQVIHPQHWPEDLDYAGKKVVVIGSGATAVTLLPAMADKADHVTMLQRTPSYILPLPKHDPVANIGRAVLGDERGYALARWKNILQQRVLFEACQRFPKTARRVIRGVNKKLLPEGFDVDTHFNPPYNPWDQRLCAVPDGDLFRTIRQGKASVVTDRIKTFTEKGILLESGQELEADIIVTATGLNLQLFGGVKLNLDGEPIAINESIVYRGFMLSGIPNFALAIGYTNSSWTLKVGLLCEHFVRLLAYMDARGYPAVRPIADSTMETRPLLDFGAGYVQRSIDWLPRQGVSEPWSMSMSYYKDRRSFAMDVADPNLEFTKQLPAADVQEKADAVSA